jgi:hypothetical protein
MPALGHTITEETIAADIATMTPGERDRAYLNRWTETVDTVIPLERFRAVCDDNANPGHGSNVWIAADMTPERDAGAIIAAGRMPDGRIALEVIDHRPETDWIRARVDELLKVHHLAGCVIDATGPAAGLAEELLEKPMMLKYRDSQQASASMFDAIMYGTAAFRTHPSFENAIRGAAKLGAGDVWRWGRRRSSADVSPLVAASMAHHAVKLARTGSLTIW